MRYKWMDLLYHGPQKDGAMEPNRTLATTALITVLVLRGGNAPSCACGRSPRSSTPDSMRGAMPRLGAAEAADRRKP